MPQEFTQEGTHSGLARLLVLLRHHRPAYAVELFVGLIGNTTPGKNRFFPRLGLGHLHLVILDRNLLNRGRQIADLVPFIARFGRRGLD